MDGSLPNPHWVDGAATDRPASGRARLWRVFLRSTIDCYPWLSTATAKREALYDNHVPVVSIATRDR